MILNCHCIIIGYLATHEIIDGGMANMRLFCHSHAPDITCLTACRHLVDAETETFSIQNCLPLSATYNRAADGITYNLMAMTMYTNGSSVYRNRSTDLATVGTLYEDEETGTIGFTFDINDVLDHNTYSFYALRIAYTTGGYDGYTGSFVSYNYCELEKVVEE